MKRIERLPLIGLCLVFTIVLGCSSGGGSASPPAPAPSPSPASTYLGTQNPGDVWVWSFNHSANTFSATNQTKSHTYSGSFTTLANGFLQLTVTVTNDPGVTVPATAYALEVPNTALLVQPPGTFVSAAVGWRTNLIIAGALGSCPSVGGSFNNVSIPTISWNSTVNQAYGIATITLSGGQASGSENKFRLDGTSLGADAISGTCSNGVFTSAVNRVSVVFTPSGTFIVDDPDATACCGQSGVVGVAAPASNVDLNAVAAANYRGFLYYYPSGAPAVNPFALAPGPSGTLLASGYTDFANNQTTPLGTITFNSQPSPGIVRSTLVEVPAAGGNTLHPVSVVLQINGKFILWGISDHPGDTTGELFMALQQ